MSIINNRNPIAKAVKYALFAGATVTSLSTTAIFAAEEGVSEDRKITITGSRISRTDRESALPVTTITAEDIRATGLTSISEVIAQLPFNTQGSFVSASGSSASNHSSSGLRGLGSNRTLTLINGKRIAPSATFSGESTNLNLIPLEAVERIDVLRDGAAAIYGSDAIGGVINVILKTDYDGLSMSISAGRPSGDGGDEDGFNVVMGASGEKGSYIVVLEHKEWEGIQFGTRAPVLNANFETGYNRSSLYTPYGNYRTIDDAGDTGPWMPGDCPADQFIASVNRCGWAFLDGKSFIPERKKDSVFANFIYNINNDMTLTTQVMVVKDSTLTGSTSVWTPGGIRMSALNPNNPTFGTAGASDIMAYTRLVGVADRNTWFESNTGHVGSTLSWDIGTGVLDISASASRQDVNNFQEHYIFRDRLDEAVENPDGNYSPDTWYNPFVPGGDATEETLNSFLHTQTRRAFTVTNGADAIWSDETEFSFDGGNISYAAGVEFQNYSFSDELDRQSAPGGNAFPTFGGNSGGSRDYYAVFGEIDLPILDNLNVIIASRYDKYSKPDKGQLSSSMNVRYEVTEDIVLRASYSQGFRAPSIDDLLSEEALSFNRVTDTLRCAAGDQSSDGVDDFGDGQDWCGDGVQIQRRSEGNINLGPETSDQYAFGLVWAFTDDMSMTLDYYDIQINDQVQFLGAQDVVDLEGAGLLGNFDQNAVNITRDVNNIITNVQTGSINQVGTSTSGIDFEFNAKFQTDDWGIFSYKFIGAYALEYETQATPLSARQDEIGTVTTPEYRFTTRFGYAIGDFTTQLTYRYIASYSDLTFTEALVGNESTEVKPWGIMDINGSYDFGDYGRIQVGVRNLADKLPVLNQTFRNGFDTSNQDVYGRIVYSTYSINF